MSFTIRCWTNDHLERLQQQLISLVELTANRYRLTPRLHWKEHFAATENDPTSIDLFVKAAQELSLDMEEISTPQRFGEDFGKFTRQFPGAIVGLGAGIQHPPLHDPAYDFPDQILSTGISLFTQIMEVLNMFSNE